MSEVEMIECPTCTSLVDEDMLIPAGTTQVCAHCRDEYLQKMREGVSTNQTGEWVAIREEHIKHEASLRSIGLLYYLAAFFMILGGLGMLVSIIVAPNTGEGEAFIFGGMLFYLVFGVIAILVGRGYRKLKPWVRIPGTIFAVFGLLGFPIGTLINAYVLYLLHSGKGRMIFSAEYQEIRDATPEVVYRTSFLSWIVLIVLVLGLFALIGYFSMQ